MKFIYISDTHFGAGSTGYQQQKKYPGHLDILAGCLRNYIEENSDIDFILHGGDMIERAVKENIAGARELFTFPVPVYLCLGNHDLTDADALGIWKGHGGTFFPDGCPDYTIGKDDVFIHVMPNQWTDIPYFWDEKRQDRHFLVRQLEGLQESMTEHPHSMHVICTHSPVVGVPSEQTGFEDPYHHPGEEFSQSILSIVEKYPSIKAVLSAHNHINTHVEKNGVHFVTASAFSEAPFECKLIEISPERMEMSTIPFISTVDFKVEYDYDKTYVQGRRKDRRFVHQFK